MAAELQGVLRPAAGPRRRLVAALLVLGACAGTAVDVSAPGSGRPAAPASETPAGGTSPGAKPPGDPASRDPLPVSPPVVVPQVAPAMPGDLGPEVLLPSADAVDGEVARIGDLVLRQSQAYARLLSANPKVALLAVDLLVFDVLVARHAQQFGIRVREQRVEEVAAKEEQALQKQVEAEFDGLSFGDFVWRQFGMRLSDWQQALRLQTAQRLYQAYVLRYLAMREDRVQVRFLVHKDEKVAREVADKVRHGADFATLALRWSEDPSRRDGGLLPPFGRGFRHPAAQPAFELGKGEVSAPFEAQWGGEPRWFVVYCLDRMEGRDVPFEEVREEIERDLENQPITQLEQTAYVLRWREEAELQTPPPATGSGSDR